MPLASAPGKVSATARHVAFFRALESAGRPGTRLFHDPYATAFLDPKLAAAAHAARVPSVRAAIVAYVDRTHPGARLPVVVRTKLIDDAVEEGIRGGAESLVLLGAGFDTRAVRLPAAAGVPVFELDMAPTQEFKKERLERRLGQLPANVAYVPFDLEASDVGGPLERAGLAPEARSVFVWEGVVSYLTEQAVDGTLRWVAGADGGSRLIMTYVDVAALEDGRPPWAGAISRSGEPFRFGFDSAALPAYLERRGLRLAWDRSIAEAVGPGQDGAPAYYRVALAEVAA